MRFFSILFFLFPLLGFTQTTVKMGVSTETVTQELQTKDEGTGIYYNGYPMPLKAGQMIYFSLWTEVENLQLLVDNSQRINLFTAKTEPNASYEKGNKLTYRFVVPKDDNYSLYVVNTVPGNKGTYRLFYQLFDENQVNFKKELPICDRFNFVFDLCFSGFNSLEKETVSGLEFYKTDAKLWDQSDVSITALMSSYTETILKTTNKQEALDQFEKCHEQLKGCIDASIWIEEDNTNTDYNILNKLKWISYNVKPGLGADKFSFNLSIDVWGKNNFEVRFYYIR